jgi:hypothetical protein
MTSLKRIAIGILAAGLSSPCLPVATAQEGPKEAGEPKPNASAFVDRDGDGIQDGMEHRFRRHKRDHGKKGAEDRGLRRQRKQSGKP